MAFVERLKIVLDMEGDQAKAGLRSIGKEISAADGLTNKFKAGWSGMKKALSDNATALGVTAGAALAAGLYKAVDASADLGIEVGKLADATGLATEDASRWIEVADDMGIGADKVAGLIEKMTKNIGASPDKFKALGIEMQYTADGAVDMNATLLTSIDRINAIADPTKRAKAAADLFGKGWDDAAELIGMSSQEIAKRLSEVGDAKVFSDGDVKDSRDYRDAMADLGDVMGDLSVSIGKELVPALTAAAKGAKSLVDTGSDVSGFFDGIIGDGNTTRVVLAGVTLGASELIRVLSTEPDNKLFAKAGELGLVLTKTGEGMGDMTAATEDARSAMFDAERQTEGLTAAQKAGQSAARVLADVLDDQADAAHRAADGARDAEGSALDMADAYDDMNEAVQRSIDVSNDENATQAEKDRAYRDVRRAQLDAAATAKKHAEDVAASSGAVAGSTANIKLQIAELQRQKALYPELSELIDGYIKELGRIPAAVTTNVGVRYGGGAGGTGANGTGVSGDAGNIGTGGGFGRVQSVGSGRGGAAPIVNQTINVYATGDGRAMVDAITAAVKDGVRAAWMAGA